MDSQTSNQQGFSSSSLKQQMEDGMEFHKSELQKLEDAFDKLFGNGETSNIETRQSRSSQRSRSSTISDREIPKTRDGSIDRRTVEGRQSPDDEISESFEGMTVDDALENAQRNKDGNIDLRTKEGRYLMSKGVVDDKGIEYARRHWKAQDSDFRRDSEYLRSSTTSSSR